MQNPASVPATSTRADASAPARPGQVPAGARALARLCFFSPSGDAPRAEAWRRLDELGLGLALGVEPAERRSLGWNGLIELVRRAGELASPRGFVAGASTDSLATAGTISEQLEGVVEQALAIEEAGGLPLLLPLAVLSRRRAREDEYVEVYRTLLGRLAGPVLIDWTGPAARPELMDYFPGKSFERVLALDPAKVRGARLVLADVARETRLRRECLQRDQLVFTADREHLGRLLLGMNPGPAAPRLPAVERQVELAGQTIALGDFSHALLSGTLAEAERLASALARLDAGDAAGLLSLLE